MDTQLRQSPFKFLASYDKDDRELFFGRDAETEELYDRIFESNLILLYGATGTGKTSLINCGLANQFDNRDWLPIMVRRQTNMLQSVQDALLEVAVTPFTQLQSLAQNIRSVYLDHYKPLYLIFDQFEELFVLGSEGEQIAFFEHLKEVLNTGLSCKVLLSLRGDYLDQLSRYELIIPQLLDNRMYLERMSRRQLLEVIEQTTQYYEIELVDKENILRRIVDNLADAKGGVELTNLQIYLDKLYRNDLKRQGALMRPVQFDEELLDQTRQIENVLTDFLEEQIQQLELELQQKGNRLKNIPLDVLFALVTADGTKKLMTNNGLIEEVRERRTVAPELIDYCIRRFTELRIIRSTAELS